MKRYLLYLGLFSFLSALSGNVTDAVRLAAVQEEIATLEAQIDEWRSEFGLSE